MIILELLRVVDNNGNDTNEILEREELHNRGKLHNEVTIYIINNKKAIAVLTINTAIAFYYSFSLGLAVTDIHSAFT